MYNIAPKKIKIPKESGTRDRRARAGRTPEAFSWPGAPTPEFRCATVYLVLLWDICVCVYLTFGHRTHVRSNGQCRVLLAVIVGERRGTRTHAAPASPSASIRTFGEVGGVPVPGGTAGGGARGQSLRETPRGWTHWITEVGWK